MYGNENPTFPSCLKSRTGFVITFENWPVLWKIIIAERYCPLEAEVIALDHSFYEFFPIFDMAKDLSGSVGHPIGDTTMNVSIHEDNSDMLVLADLLPP